MSAEIIERLKASGLYNMDVLFQLIDLDDEDSFTATFFDGYLEDAELNLQKLHEILDGPGTVEDKWYPFRETAHSCKSASLSAGAEKLAHVLAELQRIGESKELARAPEVLAKAEALFAHTKVDFKALADSVRKPVE